MPSLSYDPEAFTGKKKKDNKSDTTTNPVAQLSNAMNSLTADQALQRTGNSIFASSMAPKFIPGAMSHPASGGGGGGGGGASMPFTGAHSPSPGTWDDFYSKFLQREGIPVTQSNMDFMRRWNRAEGNGAAWNPWNTTQQAPGATNFNSVGVKNFPNEDVALNAYVGLFNRNPNWYGQILNSLKGTNEMAMAQAVKSSPWGTSNIFNVMR